ncbi:LCP family protein [Streptomyces sp. TS71-3]|uniref:LCP family protein n=1 Tax=Streptomyces sp. TS71-3 TaxID=2733862 RepID=UPI0035AB72F1
MRRRTKRRWAIRTATTMSVVVLAAAGIGHAVVSSLDGGIDRVEVFKDMKNRPEPGHGMNVLLVGTDGRDKITPAERAAFRLGGAPCHCTDTMMIVHLSEDHSRASVVSLPRDSYAEVPDRRDPGTGRRLPAHPIKINAAYAEGGPSLAVRTVEHMTGVKIDHYLEVDFTSFMKTVDVLGGVEVCTPVRLRDTYTGLDLAAGRHRLHGGEALQYVRSRHVDGASDLGRVQRQQRFLASLISEATSSGVLLNPVKFAQLTSTVLGSVRADGGFGPHEMLDLGQAMRGFSPSSSEFATVPVREAGRPVRGLGETVRWDGPRARELFDAIREDRPLAPAAAPGRARVVEVAPQGIRVQVENGTGIPGLAHRVDAALRSTGFRTTGAPGTAPGHDAQRTVIVYDPHWNRSAKTLAAALPGSELRPAAGRGAVFKVIAGTDFKEVTRVRAGDPGDRRGGAVTGDEVACT